MKITVYTTTDCQYSKQEKDYLAANNLQYEEKNLETNKEFLTEMLAVSNNFSGTPVTRVEKDDGAIVVLKGFTKEEFDAAFGLSAEPAKTEPLATEPISAPPTSVITPVEASPIQEPPKPVEEAPQPPKSEELNQVMDKLEEKTAPPVDANAPSIPNFPSDDPAKTNA